MNKNKLYGIKKIYGDIDWGGFGILRIDFIDFSNDIYYNWSNGKKPKKKHIQKLLQTCNKFIELNKHIKK